MATAGVELAMTMVGAIAFAYETACWIHDMVEAVKDANAVVKQCQEHVAEVKLFLEICQRKFTGDAMAEMLMKSITRTLLKLRKMMDEAQKNDVAKMLKAKDMAENMEKKAGEVRARLKEFVDLFDVKFGTFDCTDVLEDLYGRVFWAKYVGRDLKVRLHRLEAQSDHCARQ